MTPTRCAEFGQVVAATLYKVSPRSCASAIPALYLKKIFVMKKLAISALASACAVAANSNLAISGEPDKWYIETSLGFKDYTRSNIRGPSEADYLGRWVDFNYGTDIALSIGYYIRNDLRISAGYTRSKQQSLNFFNSYSAEENNFINRIDAYVVSIYKDFPITNNS